MNNYERGLSEGRREGVEAVTRMGYKLTDARKDAAEWKEQHENLLAMYRAELDRRVAAESELEAARIRTVEAEKDAERYGRMRNLDLNALPTPVYLELIRAVITPHAGPLLDAAIDRALSGKKEMGPA